MELAIWIVILFVLVYEPIVGYIGFQKFKQDVKTNPLSRTRFYIDTMMGLWAVTLFILLVAVFTELTFEEMGIRWPAFDAGILGPVVTYAVLGMAVLYLAGLLYYFIGYRYSEKIRTQLLQAKEKEWEKAGFSEILPVTEKEKRLWNYVSITAAITEELIYRGFLLFAIAYLFPQLSIWVVMLLASVVFGLAHTYQGVTGVLKTSVVGLIFSVLYVSFGSILPLIVLHFLIDYFAKVGEDTAESPA